MSTEHNVRAEVQVGLSRNSCLIMSDDDNILLLGSGTLWLNKSLGWRKDRREICMRMRLSIS